MHGQIVLTKFDGDWTKIVNFLLLDSLFLGKFNFFESDFIERNTFLFQYYAQLNYRMMISLSLNPSTMGSWLHTLDALPVKIHFKVLGLLIWTTMEKLTGMNFWYNDKYSCGISVPKDCKVKVS